MKLGIWNQRKILTITLSTACAILMTMNGMAQDKQSPQGLISIEARLIEMPRLAADELFKEQGGLPKASVINEKTLGAIRDMVINNKAQIVSQGKIITHSGSNCKNRSVREVIYPTEYDVRRSNATNSVKALPDIIIPAAFETRECGTIFDITPTIGPDNKSIELMCLF